MSADSFSGLRALLIAPDKRQRVGRRGRSPASGVDSAGRWALLGSTTDEPDTETIARVLLKRYGIVFRALLEREARLPGWRDLALVYRRLEARGEIRGGRFVRGFGGEQFALPDAVGRLRAVRKDEKKGEWTALSGADPLNLVGILTPQARVSAIAGNRILFRDGVPVAALEAGGIRRLAECELSDDQVRPLFWRRSEETQLRLPTHSRARVSQRLLHGGAELKV